MSEESDELEMALKSQPAALSSSMARADKRLESMREAAAGAEEQPTKLKRTSSSSRKMRR
jgi:hypothetical protein